MNVRLQIYINMNSLQSRAGCLGGWRGTVGGIRDREGQRVQEGGVQILNDTLKIICTGRIIQV